MDDVIWLLNLLEFTNYKRGGGGERIKQNEGIDERERDWESRGS